MSNDKAREPLLPCPLPGCGGQAKVLAHQPHYSEVRLVGCSEKSCLLWIYGDNGGLRKPVWQSLPRRSAEAAEVVREMDGEIAEGGDAIEMGAVRSWRDKLAGSAPAECAKCAELESQLQQVGDAAVGSLIQLAEQQEKGEPCAVSCEYFHCDSLLPRCGKSGKCFPTTADCPIDEPGPPEPQRARDV